MTTLKCVESIILAWEHWLRHSLLIPSVSMDEHLTELCGGGTLLCRKSLINWFPSRCEAGRVGSGLPQPVFLAQRPKYLEDCAEPQGGKENGSKSKDPCIDVPHLHPFLCWRTFRLVLCPGYIARSAAMNITQPRKGMTLGHLQRHGRT